MDQDDDLIGDIMNIVQNDNTQDDDFGTSSQENLDGANSDFDSEIDDFDQIEIDEIDQMLEKPIDDQNIKDEINYYTYDKLQIKHIYWKGLQDTMLPEGWVQVTHASGMPLYLHRQLRCCTLSRPYFIGQSSARKHEIPVSAIPCLAFKKRKEEIEKQINEHKEAKNEHQSNDIENVSDTKKCPFSHNKNEIKQNVVVSIQTNEDKAKENLLAPNKVNEYCRNLFEFDVIKVKKFKTWNDRKKYIRKSRQKKFPENAKMLKIQTKTQKGLNKELNINITNKTPLSILYEYSCQVFKTNPRFEIQEKENPKDPFLAIVYINDKICGKGSGNSKKAAKNNAAEEALKVLIPDYKGQENQDSKKSTDDTYTFFDGYDIEHAHIYQLSQSLGAPLPYDVLLTCLKYNFALNATRNRKDLIEEEIKPIKFRNCLYRMKLAQYEVEVNCARKKDGRQLAAQKILKQMHPHVQTWGGILRLYGSRVAESYLKMDVNDDNNKNSDNDESTVQKEQTNKRVIEPNKDLLEKLKEEMRKLRKTSKSVGKIELNLSNNTKTKDSIMTIKPLVLPIEQNDNKQLIEFNTNATTTADVYDTDIIKFSDSYDSNPTITQMMSDSGMKMDFFS